MKTLKALCLIALFTVTFFTANAAIEPVNSPDDLQSQLSEIIMKSEAFNNLKESTTLKVRFMISSDSQVIILGTSSEEYDASLKSLLNYKQLDVTPEMHGKVYVLPVRLEKA
jgi:hypothetical protein